MRWTRARSGWGRGAAALAIAYLLVLQAVVGGLALGSHAAMAATFDAPICNPSGTHPGDGSGPGERHSPSTLCCVLGCAPVHASHPGGSAPSVHTPSASSAPAFRPAGPSAVAGPQRLVNTPRAPPV